MEGSDTHILLMIAEAKKHLQEGEDVKTYQTLLDIEEEFHQRNEEIEDIDVSSSFDQSKIDEIKKSTKNPENMNPSNAEPIEKARLIVGYIDNR